MRFDVTRLMEEARSFGYPLLSRDPCCLRCGTSSPEPEQSPVGAGLPTSSTMLSADGIEYLNLAVSLRQRAAAFARPNCVQALDAGKAGVDKLPKRGTA